MARWSQARVILRTHLAGEIHFHTPGKDNVRVEMDFLVREAAVVELSAICGDCGVCTSKMVEERVKEGDILILHTGCQHFEWDQPGADEIRYMGMHPWPNREFAVWAEAKRLRRIGVDCGSADHPMHTILRDWMPRQADREFQKKTGPPLADYVDHSRDQLMHLERFPSGIIHSECLSGDDDYGALAKKQAALPKTKLSDRYDPSHVERLNELTSANMS
jgi:arylformamidase